MDLSLRSIRKGISAFSVLAVLASMFVTINVANAAYGDVPADAWYAADVQWGLDNGILDSAQAYFRGGDNATRAEFSKMTAAAAGIPEAACDETLFPDVKASHWGCGWVTALANAGVVSGDGASSATPGYFRPNDNVLRAEAGKIVVEAFDLTATAGTLGSDYFTDSVVGTWYDEYLGIARYNCVFQGVNGGNTVEPGRNIVRAEAIAVVHRGDNPVTTCITVESGALTVALDGSSPDSVYIPQNGANIPYSVFALTASSEEAINVEQLIITREGLGLPGDFKSLKIYVDGVQKGGEKTINTSTNTATFNLTSDPIAVPAGSTVLVEVRADMNGVTGSQNKLCVKVAEDVTAMGDASNVAVTVGGAFAVCGNEMSTTSAAVGSLGYSITQPSQADINVGDADVVMTKVKMEMVTEDVEVNRITFKQTGSASEADFGNISLWMSGSLYSDNATWSGDYVTFDLTDAPIAIAKGNSKTVELHADIVGGLASTAGFDIYRDWHIEGTGQTYNYGVNVVECPGTVVCIAGVSNAIVARNIIGGNVAFSLSANNPVTGDVKKGANDHPFTKFNISTGGDGVTVQKLSLTVNGTDFNDITDVKIWTKNASDVWYVVAGPQNPTAALPQTLAFTDQFEVPAATTQEFMVTADISNGATALDVYDIDVTDVTNAGATELEYLSDGTPINVTTEVTGGMLNGNVMTVNTPTLTVALSATPGDKTYVRNTSDRELVAFDMTASSADDLRVTSVVVKCSDTPESGAAADLDALDNDVAANPLWVNDGVVDEGDLQVPTIPPFPLLTPLGDATADNGDVAADPVAGKCSTAFQTLKLYEKDGSTLTLIDSSARTMADATNNDGTVTFSLNHTIEKGSTSRLLVRGNIASGANQDGYRFEILAGGVSAEDTDSSAAAILGLGTAARTVIVAAQGLLSNQSVTDTSLQARIVSGLSLNEPVMKVKFSASPLEAWIVKKMQFDLPVVGAPFQDADVSKIYVKYVDSLGTTQTKSGTISGDTVLFEGMDIYVPADGTQTVDVSIDAGVVTAGGATTGDVFTVLFNGAGTYQAVGASSAALVAAANNVTSNPLRIAKSYPIVNSNDNISSAMSTNSELYSVTIAADDAGAIGVKQLCFNVVNGAAGAYTPASAKLYRSGESTDLVTAGEVTLSEGAGLCGGVAGTDVLVQWLAAGVGGEDEVAAGTSKTYILKGAVTGVATGDKVTTVLIGDNTVGGVNAGVVATATAPYTVAAVAEYFVWSDLSASPHVADENNVTTLTTSADYLDGYLVQGLSSVVAHEVKF